MPHLEIPAAVLNQAAKLGVDPYPDDDSPVVAPSKSIRGQILTMVRGSAPITHPKGNRRYDEWVFRVDDNAVMNIHLIQCETCDDKKRITQIDICGYCEGEGCSVCGNQPEREVLIPCPACAMK